MKSNRKKIVLLIIGITLGICIVFAPNIVTGRHTAMLILGAFWSAT